MDHDLDYYFNTSSSIARTQTILALLARLKVRGRK